MQPRQCRYDRRQPPQQKARSNCGYADLSLLAKGCVVQFHRHNEFRKGEDGHRIAITDSDLLEGKKPAGCVVQCTCSMWAFFFGVAWEIGVALLVDRTNTETIAQEPKHAPTYTAQRRLTWQEHT